MDDCIRGGGGNKCHIYRKTHTNANATPTIQCTQSESFKINHAMTTYNFSLFFFSALSIYCKRHSHECKSVIGTQAMLLFYFFLFCYQQFVIFCYIDTLSVL